MYEERYIAFIDILGFKNIVTNTFNFPELSGIFKKKKLL